MLASAGAFAKYHALGNDYLVVDGHHFGPLSPSSITALCSRHTGIGADGVLVRVAPQQGGAVALRIFNPDGSEAEKSGNGLRIFLRCMLDCGVLRPGATQVEVGGACFTATVSHAPPAPPSVAVEMGRASFLSTAVHMQGPPREVVHEPLPLPEAPDLHITAVSVGNPHCVVLGEGLDVRRLRLLGPLLERHPAFLQRTNVQLAQVLSPSRIDMLVWERGAGETSASGSSSCAVVAAARRAGLVGQAVAVHMPGGMLQVDIDAHYALTLRGPVSPVCHGMVLADATG